MASYAIIKGNPTSGLVDTGLPLALVVTDGIFTHVYGEDDVANSLREDVDWGVGTEADVLRFGLTGLSYYTIDGPHTFEGDAKTSGPVLARTYGLG